jgi:hypothetical protein
MALTAITYGAFNLNDGVSYFTIAKSLAFPAINPSMYKIGRLEGMKKVGENINERKISLTVRVVGVSRSDLENKLDTLLNALWQRGQQLCLHSNDNRYFICDCVDVKYAFGTGQIISTTAQIDFIAYTPFAFASTQSSYDTGIVVFPANGTALGSTAYTQSFQLAGGGNVYTRPIVTITNQQPFMQVTLTSAATLNVNYTSINVTATTQDLYQGDDLILKTGLTTQSVVVSANTPAGATTVPVGGFLPNITFPIGATVTRDSTINFIHMNQTNDQQVLRVSSLLPSNYGDDLVINCDPLTTNGYTAILNGGTTISAVAGSFPVLEPVTTNYTFTINANSVPQLEIVWNWNTRWLS